MRRVVTLLAVAALAMAAAGCHRKAHSSGPTTGDGIAVDDNGSNAASAPQAQAAD